MTRSEGRITDRWDPAVRRVSRGRDGFVLGVTLLAVVLVPFTLTGVSVALDGLGSDLRAGPESIQWVVNGYSATFAGFMLITGTLADRWGPRRVFGSGVALFALCGLLSSVASSIVVLDIARLVAGAGAAATVTGSSALLAAQFGAERRAHVFGAFGTAIGGGLALGPSVAGVVTDALGWRAVFAVPAVLGLALVVATRWLPAGNADATSRLDVPGAVTFTGALLLLILGLVEGSVLGWTSPLVLGSFGLAVASLVAFVVIERRTAHPLLDVRAVLTAPFVGSCVAVSAAVGAFGPLLIYLPTLFQVEFGVGAAEAGVLLLALTAPSLVVPLLCGWLTRWIQPRILVVAGLVLVSSGCASFAAGWGVVAPLVVAGTGIAVAQGLLDGIAIGAAPSDAAGAAAGAFNTAKLTAETVGIAAVGAALIAATGGPMAGPVFPPTLRAVVAVLAGLVAAGAVTAGLLLGRRAPAATANGTVVEQGVA